MHTVLGKKSLPFAIGFLGSLFLFGGVARATHRTWVRHDGGTLCQKHGLNSTTGSLVVNQSAWNPGRAWEEVVCAVNLAGLFTDLSDPAGTPTHTNTAALQADVYVRDANDAAWVECWMEALTSTGSASWSESRYSCATEGGCDWPNRDPGYTGPNRLAFADPQIVVNRRLGVSDALTRNDVRSLAFVCRIPPSGSRGSSAVTGVKTAICQRDSSTAGQACRDVNENP
jgi:hypothetical protein